jgi:hypothetical protein
MPNLAEALHADQLLTQPAQRSAADTAAAQMPHLAAAVSPEESCSGAMVTTTPDFAPESANPPAPLAENSLTLQVGSW